jgi:transcriptional regulator with XRE-family HTH domain
MDSIKAWREARGLSIAEAALQARVKRETWWRWEAERRPIGIDSLSKISALTGIAPNVLRPDLAAKLGAAA